MPAVRSSIWTLDPVLDDDGVQFLPEGGDTLRTVELRKLHLRRIPERRCLVGEGFIVTKPSLSNVPTIFPMAVRSTSSRSANILTVALFASARAARMRNCVMRKPTG